jgi:hypothetical protein
LEIKKETLSGRFFVFESWQTTLKSQGKTITSYVSIGPDKWPIFGRFLTLFPLKRPALREKIPPIWRMSVDDVIA